jgi:hypothetical protein
MQKWLMRRLLTDIRQQRYTIDTVIYYTVSSGSFIRNNELKSMGKLEFLYLRVSSVFLKSRDSKH